MHLNNLKSRINPSAEKLLELHCHSDCEAIAVSAADHLNAHRYASGRIESARTTGGREAQVVSDARVHPVQLGNILRPVQISEAGPDLHRYKHTVLYPYIMSSVRV